MARFDGGREVVCDLLIGADGPGSTVRQQLLPSVRSEYAGYVAWRGVVVEHQSPDLAAEFADRFTFFQAPHTHILSYLIPGPDGSLQPGQRRLNWVWYLNAAPGDDLDRVLTDKDGRRREFSVPQGKVAPDMLGRLHDQAQPHFAATFPPTRDGDPRAVRSNYPRSRRSEDGLRASMLDRGCGIRSPAPHGGEYSQSCR